MAYKSDNWLFRDLDDMEEEAFRLHAQAHPPEDMGKWDIYHPVCREEWVKMGIMPDWVKKIV